MKVVLGEEEEGEGECPLPVPLLGGSLSVGGLEHGACGGPRFHTLVITSCRRCYHSSAFSPPADSCVIGSFKVLRLLGEIIVMGCKFESNFFFRKKGENSASVHHHLHTHHTHTPTFCRFPSPSSCYLFHSGFFIKAFM